MAWCLQTISPVLEHFWTKQPIYIFNARAFGNGCANDCKIYLQSWSIFPLVSKWCRNACKLYLQSWSIFEQSNQSISLMLEHLGMGVLMLANCLQYWSILESLCLQTKVTVPLAYLSQTTLALINAKFQINFPSGYTNIFQTQMCSNTKAGEISRRSRSSAYPPWCPPLSAGKAGPDITWTDA